MMDTPTPVEAVVVRTTRLPPSPGDPAFSIIRIDPRRLRSADRLDDALTATPGAALFRRTSSLGANPTTQGLSLREIAPSGAGRALVLLDGAPQNDPFGGWVIWSALPPEGIAGGELVRGAGAGPYGAGALTGVVSLQSVDAPSVRAEGSAGELGRSRAALAAAGARPGLDGLVVASAERSDGWIPVQEGRGRADTPLTLDAASAALRVQADAGAAVLAVRLAAYEESRDSGLVGADSRARGVNASATLAQSGQGGLGWRVQAWAASTDLQNRSVAVAADRVSTTPANDQYETPATGYGFNAALRGEGGRWEVGGDLRVSEGEVRERSRFMAGAFTRDRVAGGRATVGGLYAEGRHASGPWLVTGGVRADRWSTSEGKRVERDLTSGAVTLSAPSADRDGWVPTARAGVRRDWSGFYLRAAAYAGFRPPTLNELHRPFRVGNDITEANAALEPERLYGVEAGVGGTFERGGWSLTLFNNRLQDPVTNVTVGEGPASFPIAGFVPAGGVLRQRQNAGRIDAVGLEGEAHHQLTRRVGLRGAFAYTDAQVDGGSAAPQLTGLRPAQAPRFSAGAWLQVQVSDRVEAQLGLRHEGERFEDDLNSRKLGAYTTVDARVAAGLGEGVEVFVAADNLADADVATGQTASGVTSYGPPRAVRLGLTLRR